MGFVNIWVILPRSITLASKQLLFIGILSMLYGLFSLFLYIGGAGIRAKHIASPPLLMSWGKHGARDGGNETDPGPMLCKKLHIS